MQIKTICFAALSILASDLCFAQVCLEKDIMSPAGQAVSSPYGVNRTGRRGASPGYHQGLDIINSAGSGTPIYSGSSGEVRFYPFSGGGVVADVNSGGSTRFIYLHMNQMFKAGTSKNIQAGTQIGTMGCAGMSNCAVHLHLYTLVKGSVLSKSGYSGRTWSFGAGKSASPLSVSSIQGALPDTWYYVNPEPYLPRQIPIRNTYPDMPGGVRKTTLSKTCTPGKNEAPTTNLLSSADTASREAVVAGSAGVAGSEDHAFKTADMPIRSIYIELARQNATELVMNASSYEGTLAASMAQLTLVKALE